MWPAGRESHLRRQELASQIKLMNKLLFLSTLRFLNCLHSPAELISHFWLHVCLSFCLLQMLLAVDFFWFACFQRQGFPGCATTGFHQQVSCKTVSVEAFRVAFEMLTTEAADHRHSTTAAGGKVVYRRYVCWPVMGWYLCWELSLQRIGFLGAFARTISGL